MHLQLIDEFRLDSGLRGKLGALLAEAFPEALSARIYAKQVPQRRLLAWREDALVGHIGLEYRIVSLRTGPATIFGLVDVCVAPSARSQGIASKMIAHIEGLALETGVEFALLFAHDDRLYSRCGYRRPGNTVRWLKIHEHESIGLGEAALQELMVKELSSREWPDGFVDLLGYQF